MKSVSGIRFSVLLAVGLLACSALHADIIILNSGERIEGKILSEDAASLTIQYQLTPKIKDTKVIQKADVKQLTRFTAAQIEIEERGLRKLLPTADLMKASDYEALIQDQLRSFVARHPGTPEAKEVEQMIATLSDEKTKVLSGQLKVEGKWLDEASAKRETYNIEAYRARRDMKARAAENTPDNLLLALREFERLRTSFPASLQYVQAIPEALEILDNYEKRLNGMAAEQPIILAEREKGLKILSGPDLALTKSSIEQEQRNFKASYDAQTKAKVKWRDVYKYDLKSIQDALLTVSTERVALKNIDMAALQAECAAISAAISYLADRNATAADEALTKLRPGRAQLINKKAFDDTEKQLKSLKETLAKEAKTAKSSVVTSAPDSTPGEPGAEGVNPIAEAMSQSQKKKEEAAGKDAEKKEGEGKPADGGTAKDSKDSKEKTEAAKTAPKPAAPLPPEEETLIQKINAYIPYIGGALLVVLIIAMVLGKKKKGDEE